MNTLGCDSTLGEVVNVMYTTYPQRSIYPVLAVAGVMYYLFWSPYKSKAEKQVWLDRQAKLASLEYHD
jgi:hypothetical protein